MGDAEAGICELDKVLPREVESASDAEERHVFWTVHAPGRVTTEAE